MERRQVEIPFSRDKRLELIERVKLPIKGYAPTRRKLRLLLTTLELVTGRDGCFPSQDTLAFRLATIPRTIRRYLDQLREIGLVFTSRKVIHGCGRELIYHVQWDRLAALPLMTDAEMAWERSGRNPPEVEEEQIEGRFEGYRADSSDSGQIRTNLPAQTEGKEEGGFSCTYTDQENLLPPGAPERADSKMPADVWGQLENEVRDFGVDLYEQPVAAAVSAGCSAQQIREAIAYAGGDHGWRVPQGALRKKLLSMRPGDAVQRHFPASAAKPAEDRKQAKERAAVADRGRAMALIGSMRQAGDSEREIQRVLTNLGQERFYQEPAGVPQ